MSNKESIAIPFDKNIAPFSKIEEIDEGSEASMSEMIVTLSCRLVGVVYVQSCTPAYKASAL